jgi:hypothetical protein
MCYLKHYVSRPNSVTVFRRNILLLSLETETSSIYWTHLNRFHVKID